MTSSAHKIFIQALDLDQIEREAFLEKACGDDAELRLEIQRLLIDAEQADSFFGDTAGATLISEDSIESFAEQEGDQIGPYTLLEPVGEGGMGTVWKAEQHEPIHRLVALKVVKAGMDTREVLARFEAERQALAIMDHPGIAKVLDAGATPTGRPYFAMELVDGIPVSQYCQAHGLGTRARLELFRRVCSAINHAHQKGIIHRDLKPSNVLIAEVEGVPVPKVIDFGIAKATEEKLTESTLQTMAGQFLGTPAYMSPEQAGMDNLDIDTRSDIYSLGVMLYELLAGRPPFDPKTLHAAGYEEMRRIIREEEPPKPSTRISGLGQEEKTSITQSTGLQTERLSKTLRGDLDWIVMRALEKERDRRYETANAFAADISRYLNDEPVEAAAPGAGYKFKKFARRNKAAFSVVAAMVVLLLGGIAATTWQAMRATAEQKIAEEERTRAEENEKSARASADAAMKANEILGSIFESLDPKEIAESGRPLQAILVDKLDYAIEELEKGTIGDPLVVARMQGKLGNSLIGLGEAEKAVRVLERACETCKRELGEDNPETFLSMHNLAHGYQEAGQLEKSLPLQEKIFELCKANLGEDHPDTLTCMSNLAAGYSNAGQLEKALPLLEEDFELCKAKLGADHHETLVSMSLLAAGYSNAGQLKKALPLQEKVFELSKAKLGEDHPDTLGFMNNVAWSYLEAGQKEKALPLQEKVFELQKAKLGADHPDTLTSMNNLALGYEATGQLEKSLPLQEEVFELMKAKLGEDHLNTLECMRNLALSYYEAGQRDKSLPLLKKVFEREKVVFPPNAPRLAGTMAQLAHFYLEVGNYRQAESKARDCLAIREKAMPRHWLTENTRSLLGGALLGQKKYAEAEPLLLAAYEGMAKVEATIPAQGKIRFAEALERLVKLYEERAADGDVERAAALRKKQGLPEQPGE